MQQKQLTRPQFRKLQEEWYSKLEATGFQDIEDTRKKDRPLKEYHSLKFKRQDIQILRASKEEYQQKIDDFLNHPEFPSVCRKLSKLGPRSMTFKQIKRAWEMHCEGAVIDDIACDVKRARKTVHDTLTRLVQWMNLL